MKLLLSLCLVLASCSVVPSNVHEGQAFGIEAVIADSLEAEATVPGFPSSSSDIQDVAAIGLRYEAFNSESTSILVGLNKREYDDADATELSFGARVYMFPETAFQTFLQGSFAGSNGWSDSGIESDPYFTAGIGGGLNMFFSRNSSVEVGLRYDTSVVAPEFNDPILGTIETDVSGTTAWFGVNFYF